MIGVGVTSVDEERLKIFLENLEANTSNYKLSVAKDINCVRKAKNKLLYDLKDCDYIYLFDDDCYPIKPGWTEFMENAFKSGQNHFCYNTKEIHGEMCVIPINEVPILITYNSGGVFMAYTKNVLQEAGFISPLYKGYGWEHLGYSQRIFRHGLNINPYLCPVGLDNFIHAEDYVNHKLRELTDSEVEQKNKNKEVFLKEATTLNPKRVLYGNSI